MAQIFDIVVENAVLSAKSTILEEAAGTPAGDRYVYIVEAAGDTLKKAKEFVVKNKGKLAALAGLAALGGGAYLAHKNGMLDDVLNHKQDQTPTDTTNVNGSPLLQKKINDLDKQIFGDKDSINKILNQQNNAQTPQDGSQTSQVPAYLLRNNNK